MAEIPLTHVTILFNGRWWIGLFERKEEANYSVARHIFGSEPSDPEIYDFVLSHWEQLSFTAPITECAVKIKRKNFKRMQREVKKLVESFEHLRPMTHAEEVLKQELDQKKKVRVQRSAHEKQTKLDQKFLLKQSKKKQKHRGH